MTARHVSVVHGVDSKGPLLAADGPFYPLFSRRLGLDVAQNLAEAASHSHTFLAAHSRQPTTVRTCGPQ